MASIRRVLPAHANLEQQQKLAKELLADLRRGAPEARERVHAALPDKKRIVLADAQFVIAREYGFTNWAALRQHLAALGEQTVAAAERFARAVRHEDVAELQRLLPHRRALHDIVNAPAFDFDS